ncbi:hypothetical protein B0H21DRAFT_136414 [Amylocystis lapponica]|nr:hypothetical protein B0H21DRAFT_136414 [Amylocystis lapponica]
MGHTRGRPYNFRRFLQNKGELAGVFTVVGLVVVAILVALITNAVRRRQAKKFDRDVAEAAADAAAQAHVPDFTDDDYGYPGDRVNGKEYPERSAYSDGSHGTFGQPAVQPAEAFNMSELPPFDSYGTAGAAGVGAAGVNRARSMGQKNTTPYNAFAGPVTMPNNYYDPSAGAYGQSSMPGGSGFAIAEAEALNGTATGLSRGPSQPSSRLSRNRSMGTTTLAGTTSPSDYSSQASHYPPAAFASYAPEPPSKEQYNTQTRPLSTDNPYGGYATPSPLPNRQSISPGTILPNPFEAMTEQQEPRPLSDNYSSPEHSAEGGSHEGQAEVSSAWQGQDESRMSLRDEEDYGFGGGRRVLKVANE